MLKSGTLFETVVFILITRSQTKFNCQINLKKFKLFIRVTRYTNNLAAMICNKTAYEKVLKFNIFRWRNICKI